MINDIVKVDNEFLEFLRAKVEELKKVQLPNIDSNDLLEKWISVLVEAQFIDKRLNMGCKELNGIINNQAEVHVMNLIRARIDQVERRINIHSSTGIDLREYIHYKLSATVNARKLLAQDRNSKELRDSWLNAVNESITINNIASTNKAKTLDDLKKALSDNPSLIKDIEEFEKTLPSMVYFEATKTLKKESEIVENSLLKKLSELTILAQKWEEAENERLRQEAEEERRRQEMLAEEERRRQEAEEERLRREAEEERRRQAEEERRRQEMLAEEERRRQEAEEERRRQAEEERLRREQEEIRKIEFVYDEKLKDSKAIVIPEGIQYIRKEAFNNFEKLETVVIPSSVTQIEDFAFCGCSSLKKIWIPDSVTDIGEGAFSGCNQLKSVRLPQGIEFIRSHVFTLCRSLESIDIPNSVSYILPYAFAECTSLKTIYLPDNLRDIGRHAFKGCSPFLVLDNLNDWVKKYSLHSWW